MTLCCASQAHRQACTFCSRLADIASFRYLSYYQYIVIVVRQIEADDVVTVAVAFALNIFIVFLMRNDAAFNIVYF